MSECESCGTEDESVELVTVAISYQYGPLMHELCVSCRDEPSEPSVPVMARIRGM